MIDINKDSRIIGDFIEINGDIISKEFNSKLPRLIKKIYFGRYKKKLLKSVDKFVDSGHILTTDNLVEFFTIIFNNFPPNGEFNSIIRCVRDDNLSHSVEAAIKFDAYDYLITIDRLEYPNFRLICRKHIDKDTTDGINITTNRLFSTNIRKSDYLEKINTKLLEEIREYIRYIILPEER